MLNWLRPLRRSERARLKEAEALVRAMHEWTGHKDTPWAKRAAALLGDDGGPSKH